MSSAHVSRSTGGNRGFGFCRYAELDSCGTLDSGAADPASEEEGEEEPDSLPEELDSGVEEPDSLPEELDSGVEEPDSPEMSWNRLPSRWSPVRSWMVRIPARRTLPWPRRTLPSSSTAAPARAL